MAKKKISPELLQKIKSSTNIIEVIGEHVVLRKSGANYSGLCPFHSERTPSFSVSESKQLYHCYGCKKGGDLVTFVMDLLGVSFPEAVADLAERGHIALPTDWSDHLGEDENRERAAQREKLALAFKLNRFAAAFFHHSLKNDHVPQQYMNRRGVDEQAIQLFYLGFAANSWDSLAHHLVSKKAPLDLAMELGLIRPSVKAGRTIQGPGYFDLFRNRVIFPILNLRGKVAGFGGRILEDQTPKYLNSSESLVFQKSKLAFGLYQAQKYIREQDEIILVEGYFDVLAMHAAGFKNVVATCGTALTVEHLSNFRRFANRVTVLFDGDQAGLAATERAMEMGLEQGCVLYGASMPPGMDPDEMVVDPLTGSVNLEGKDKMVHLLREAKPLLDEKIEEAVRLAHQNSVNRTQSLKRMGGWLARFKDPIGREVRLDLIQKQLRVSRQLIQEAMGKVPSSASNSQPSSTIRVDVSKNEGKMGQIDQILLSGVVFGGDALKLFMEARNHLPPKMTQNDLFEYPPARAFIAALGAEPGLLEKLRSSPEAVLDREWDAQLRTILTEVLVSEQATFTLEEFRGALSKSQAKLWARFSQYVKSAIADAELKKDAGLQTQLMKDYLDVQRKMKELSSFYDEE
jgi:DNA primase